MSEQRGGEHADDFATPYIPAESAEDLLVTKCGDIFACSRPNGDIAPHQTSVEGVFKQDTRYLSGFRLRLGGEYPILLSSSAELSFMAVVDLTNPTLQTDGAEVAPQMALNLRRTRLVGDVLRERIEIHNFGSVTAATDLELVFAADFVDIFEIRGMEARRRPATVVETAAGGCTFKRLRDDGAMRSTTVHLDPAPADVKTHDGRVTMTWPLNLPAGESICLEARVELADQDETTPHVAFNEMRDRNLSEFLSWRSRSTQVRGGRTVSRLMAASTRDLWMLGTPIDGYRIATAGVPWFVAPFGRDSLITCLEMLLLDRTLARETLLLLAHHQALEFDDWRDAEPGKILHERRYGDLAVAGRIPHTPYYGTVDATPLFVILAAEYLRWTGDLDTLKILGPRIWNALGWIEEYGDLDGDGFLEYERRSSAGLKNQGWKDSDDSIVHRDGGLAEGPIALAEVQGYAYMARRDGAYIFEQLGEQDRATALRTRADRLKEAFNEAFWMPDEGTFALALDGRKRRVQSVTSNAGHCLFAGIADDSKAEAVATRLLARDMHSGWGIRTLSSENRAFNPMSYHAGSVWPHDNALIAAGLKRYGFGHAAAAVAGGIFDAALESQDARLPELFCGFERQSDVPYVRYPVACSPQAWAAAAPIFLMQTMLGITADASLNTLYVNQPELPEWAPVLDLCRLQIGEATADLRFERSGERTMVSPLGHEGELLISVV